MKRIVVRIFLLKGDPESEWILVRPIKSSRVFWQAAPCSWLWLCVAFYKSLFRGLLYVSTRLSYRELAAPPSVFCGAACKFPLNILALTACIFASVPECIPQYIQGVSKFLYNSD